MSRRCHLVWHALSLPCPPHTAPGCVPGLCPVPSQADVQATSGVANPEPEDIEARADVSERKSAEAEEAEAAWHQVHRPLI